MIDFDHNATTALHPQVAQYMAELSQQPDLQGNPSSVHRRGRKARKLLEDARRRLAAAVRANPLGVTFTSGGTEADTLAVRGITGALKSAGKAHGVLSSPLEHPALASSLERVRNDGGHVQLVEVDAEGRIDPLSVKLAIEANPQLGLVSLAAANHELGNAYRVAEFVAAAKEARPEILVHSDAVQAFGKVPLDFGALELDAMSLSAHKINGPKGIGALVHRSHTKLQSLWGGGQQERGRRTGTENPISAAGFALAAELAVGQVEARREHLAPLRERLRAGLLEIEGAQVHGDPDANTANTVSASFAGCKGELLLMSLDLESVCVSTGAACSAGTLEASPVLLALGLSPERAGAALRFSLGMQNTAQQVDEVLAHMRNIVPRVRVPEALNEGAA